MAKKKIKYTTLSHILVIALIALVLVNIFLTYNLKNTVTEKLKQAEEAAEPAEIKIISLLTPDCDECYNITSDLNTLKSKNVKILDEREYEFGSEEAKLVIDKYNIEKLPSFVVLGEIDMHNLGKLEKVEDALVFTDVKAPYIDANTSEVKGLVTITLIDADCENCYDIKAAADQLKQAGLVVKQEKIFMFGTSEAKNIIDTYDIKYVPALILSRDASVYPGITDIWDQIGTVEYDGSFVLRTTAPPYIDTITGNETGLVDVIYLTDESCEECYDAMIHQSILQKFGVVLGDEKTVDVNDAEGKNLISKYNITKVPTIILSEDADIYAALKQVWVQVGSIEDDGAYVFRAVEGIKLPYRDILTGTVVS